MSLRLIDLESWPRREFYEHFIKEVVCTYSAVVNIDITGLKGQKLYPAMIWLLTKTVNDMPEFRTVLTPDGPGIYDDMHPMYTVFNRENKNFSGIWSYFSEDYAEFLKSYETDAAVYSKSTCYAPKPGTPANSFNISMVPWLEFTGFNINVFDDGKFLLPIFTMGKFFDRDGRRFLPLSIQVHHAVCDGYHLGAFAEKLQEYVDGFQITETADNTG
ncbi:MAG: type A chloramphenicol O-acetyltransferase [Oscillospiraceae bacterium]|nr:type A chloramphenicol O-acetyltransferase [Oscillospiraceae bacterium]